MFKLLFSLFCENFFLLGPTRDRLKAQLAYERALQEGYVTVYRGRILLIGQDRAGKTSLKKSLLGLPFDFEEQSTVGIEVDPSKCEIDVDQAVRDWHSIGENKPGLLESSEDVAKIVAERLFTSEESLLRELSMLQQKLTQEDTDKSSKEDFEEGSLDSYKHGRKKVMSEF